MTVDVFTVQSADTVTVTVRGPLDAVTAPSVDAFVQQTIGGLSGGQTLLVDLRELEILAAAGARVLFRAAEACAGRALGYGLILSPGQYASTVLDRLGCPPTVRIISG